ncbi:unnamed protein product, partial [Lepidochelys olivacea]
RAPCTEREQRVHPTEAGWEVPALADLPALTWIKLACYNRHPAPAACAASCPSTVPSATLGTPSDCDSYPSVECSEPWWDPTPPAPGQTSEGTGRETAQAASALTYLLAFLVTLARGKLWNRLRLSPRKHPISSTLRRAGQEVLGFLRGGYAMTGKCNLLFGWSIMNYKTFFSSSVTIVGLLVGIFN